MEELYRKDPRGCLVFGFVMFVCPALACVYPAIEDSTGFHLRDTAFMQSDLGPLVTIAAVIGVIILLGKFVGPSGGNGGNGSSLDRGAGTMSWDDHGDAGSE